MGKQWWEYVIEAFITLLATFGGVYWAIWADNKREKNSNFEAKRKLVIGLHIEIENLNKYFKVSSKALPKDPGFVESRILEDTVNEQVRYLKSKRLISELSYLRELTKQISYKIDTYLKAQIESNAVLNNRQWVGVKNNLEIELPHLYLLAIDRTGIILDLLKREIKVSEIKVPQDVYGMDEAEMRAE